MAWHGKARQSLGRKHTSDAPWCTWSLKRALPTEAAAEAADAALTAALLAATAEAFAIVAA